jgi:hypothetical protein
MGKLLGVPHTTYAGYEDPNKFKKTKLPMEWACKIADVLSERGVDRSAVMALAGAPSGVPQVETIRLALDAGLQSLTKPQATEDDLPLLAHVVSEVLIHVAKNPASEHSESFPKEVVAIAGVAVRHYKPPPEKAA